MAGLIDAVSVSLNAQSPDVYNRHCQPTLPGAYQAVLAFMQEAPRYIPEVTATAIDGLEGVDIDACATCGMDGWEFEPARKTGAGCSLEVTLSYRWGCSSMRAPQVVATRRLRGLSEPLARSAHGTGGSRRLPGIGRSFCDVCGFFLDYAWYVQRGVPRGGLIDSSQIGSRPGRW